MSISDIKTSNAATVEDKPIIFKHDHKIRQLLISNTSTAGADYYTITIGNLVDLKEEVWNKLLRDPDYQKLNKDKLRKIFEGCWNRKYK